MILTMILNKRTDIVTGQKKDKDQLIRIVKTKDGSIHISNTIKGRGAYISKDASPETIKKKKVLNRAFRTNIDIKVYEKVIDELINSKER